MQAQSKLRDTCSLETSVRIRTAAFLYYMYYVQLHVVMQDTCLYYAVSAASNPLYAVLGSFQHALLSFSYSIHHICTILRPNLSKLYSIVTSLGHQTTFFDFFTLKTFKIITFPKYIRFRRNKNCRKAKKQLYYVIIPNTPEQHHLHWVQHHARVHAYQ